MNYAIILAAGKGGRLGDTPKQFSLLAEKPLWQHSFDVFEAHPKINQVIVVGPPGHPDFIKGGATRQQSAQNAVAHLNPNPDDLLIFHNAANPFVTSEEISQVIKAAQNTGAACVAHPVTATLKFAPNQTIQKTIDRSQVYAAETPQVIRAELYQQALDQNLEGTDEMMLAEQLGLQPTIIPASANNFKITTPRDLEFAKSLLEGNEIRTGIGQDSHKFDRIHKGLTLGGLTFPEEPKTIANSDGDVMLHALCNAILGALGKGSFSSIADPLCEQGIKDSREYLRATLAKLDDAKITHVGFQIEGARPQIDPIENDLKRSIANLLQINESQIGITATTGEKLTPFGRGEGLQCFAIATLKFTPGGES